MGKETGERIGGFVQRRAGTIVLATACLAFGELGVGAMQNANGINNQVHSANSEQSLKLQDEFFNEFWLGYSFLMAAVGSAGVAGVTIYSAIKRNRSSSAS